MGDEVRAHLEEIAARATFLSERISEPGPPADAGEGDAALADLRCTRWPELVNRGWERRLRWAGLDPAEVRRRLGRDPASAGAAGPLPEWAEWLAVIVGESSTQPDSIDAETHRDHAQPFGQILHPIARFARRRMLHRCRLPLPPMTDAARSQLAASVMPPLLEVAQRTLLHELDSRRPAGRRLLARALGGRGGATSDEHYAAFVRDCLNDGMLGLYRRYPVLARLFATVVDRWSRATAEMLDRLSADLPAIAEQIAGRPARDLARISALAMGLSDRHNGHRSVAAITFESGFRTVYKPKPVGLEVAYNRLLDWINARAGEPGFRTVPVLDCTDHGWARFVAHEPLERPGDAVRFFETAGRQLGLLYALGGVDCHRENLIACGAHPFIVDCESMMTHDDPSHREAVELDGAVWDRFRESVVRTGLLPRWTISGRDRDRADDPSALGAGSSPTRGWVWKAVNTDDMHLAPDDAPATIPPNAPFFGGERVSPDRHVDDLVRGFRSMYRFVLEHREEMLGAGGPLEQFEDRGVRVILRDTRVYTVVLEGALAPECLSSGTDFGIALERLARAYLTGNIPPVTWPLLSAEIGALEQLDIPYFSSTTTDVGVLAANGDRLATCFESPSLESTRRRLTRMSADDMTLQVSLIRGAFWAGAERVSRSPPGRPDGAPGGEALPAEALIEAATHIGRHIAAHAIRGEDGGANWIGFRFEPASGRSQLLPLGESLFDGRCGVALFLAALGRANPALDLSREIEDSLRFVFRLLGLPRAGDRGADFLADGWARRMGLGGTLGLGSIIYALTVMSRLSGEPHYLTAARRACDLVHPDPIAADRKLDVTGGGAGLLLGLLALHETAGYRPALHAAIRCGDRLAVMSGRAAAGGSTTAAPAGLSHGAAGIAYALARLAGATGERAYLERARTTMELVGAGARPAGTLDLSERASTEPPLDDGWLATSLCNGAAGVGLARLGGLELMDAPAVRIHIEHALDAVLAVGRPPVAHLCCGAAGHIELLLEASRRLHRPELQREAERRASALVHEARARGYWAVSPDMPASLTSPTFYQGLAGIGYTLLRTADPERFGSIALFC